MPCGRSLTTDAYMPQVGSRGARFRRLQSVAVMACTAAFPCLANACGYILMWWCVIGLNLASKLAHGVNALRTPAVYLLHKAAAQGAAASLELQRPQPTRHDYVLCALRLWGLCVVAVHVKRACALAPSTHHSPVSALACTRTQKSRPGLTRAWKPQQPRTADRLRSSRAPLTAIPTSSGAIARCAVTANHGQCASLA